MQYKNLGKYIREQRKLANLSLNEFAFNAGIEPASLSNFENAKSGVVFDTIIKIANAFGKTAGEFLIEYEKSKFSEIK